MQPKKEERIAIFITQEKMNDPLQKYNVQKIQTNKTY